MDCLQAQQIISAALDREPVDATELAAAKEHARTCADCAPFLVGVAAVGRAGVPKPPDGLADRAAANAVETVHAERAAAASVVGAAGAGAAGATAVAARDVAQPESAPAAASPPGRERRRGLLQPRALVTFGSLAAVLLVSVSVAVLWARGAGVFSSGTAATSAENIVSAPPTADSAGLSGGQVDGGAGAARSTAKGAESSSASYIVVDGYALKQVGASTEQTATLPSAGTLVYSFESSAAPGPHPMYVGVNGGILVDDGSGRILEFRRVDRDYSGTRYQLTSGPITSTGQWPTLPRTIPAPTGTDGQPVFKRVGMTGIVNIYARVGSSPDEGIAVPPDTPTDDPAGGNPNWTWWRRAP